MLFRSLVAGNSEAGVLVAVRYARAFVGVVGAFSDPDIVGTGRDVQGVLQAGVGIGPRGAVACAGGVSIDEDLRVGEGNGCAPSKKKDKCSTPAERDP
mgnify:CR=1 FL=1